MEFSNEELQFIYNILIQCQYSQVKDLCEKIEKHFATICNTL